MVAEVRADHESEWAAIGKVAELLGVTSAETVRQWVRRSRSWLIDPGAQVVQVDEAGPGGERGVGEQGLVGSVVAGAVGVWDEQAAAIGGMGVVKVSAGRAPTPEGVEEGEAVAVGDRFGVGGPAPEGGVLG